MFLFCLFWCFGIYLICLVSQFTVYFFVFVFVKIRSERTKIRPYATAFYNKSLTSTKVTKFKNLLSLKIKRLLDENDGNNIINLYIHDDVLVDASEEGPVWIES